MLLLLLLEKIILINYLGIVEERKGNLQEHRQSNDGKENFLTHGMIWKALSMADRHRGFLLISFF